MELKPIYLLLFLLFLLTTGCFSEKCNCPSDEKILKENIQAFKEIEESNWPDLGLENSKALKSDTYRLTIFPSWTNSEVSEYIMENSLGKPKISINRYQRIDEMDKIKLRKIGHTEELVLSRNEWAEFEKLVMEKCYWTMPVSLENKYLDGTGWILEAKKSRTNICSNRNYHIVSRVADSPSYFELCDKLLKLAKSSKKEQDSLLYESWSSD